MKIAQVLTIAFTTCIFFSASAQRNLQGYFVSSQNDTVRGSFIKYKYRDKNTSDVRFKPDQKPEIALTPETVSMFEVEGQHKFYSFKGTRHLNRAESQAVPVTTFLKLIYEARGVRLFEFTDTLRSTFYLQKQGQEIDELLFVQWNDGDQVFVKDSFKHQIALAFEQELTTTGLSKQLSELEYVNESMIEFFKKLIGKPIAKPKLLYKPEFFLAAGISIIHLKVIDYRAISSPLNGNSTSLSPVISGGIQLYDRKTSGRMYYAPSLTVYRFSSEGKMEQSYAGTTTVEFKGTGVCPAFNLGYKIINGQSFQFYVQGGAGIMLFPNTTKTEKFKSYAAIPSYQTETSKMKQPYDANLNIQAGFTITRTIGIWAAYNLPMTLISETSYSVTQKIVQVGIKYLHKRKY